MRKALQIVIALFLLGLNSGEEANTNGHARFDIPIAELENQQTVDGFLPVHGIIKDNALYTQSAF